MSVAVDSKLRKKLWSPKAPSPKPSVTVPAYVEINKESK